TSRPRVEVITSVNADAVDRLPRISKYQTKIRATPEETGSRPTRAGKDRIITHPSGDETGWTTTRSLGEVGAMSVHSKPASVCSDCTFLKCDATRRQHFFLVGGEPRCAEA